MPISHTCGGIFGCAAGCAMNSRATRPTQVPMAKVMAESRNGGTWPEASVRSASSAHMATAEKPISVARPIFPPVGAGRPLVHSLEIPRPDCYGADLRADRGVDRRIYPGCADGRKRDGD